MTSVRASATLTDATSVRSRAWSLAGVLLIPATMVVIVAAVLLLLLTPVWTHFALDASGGWSAAGTRAVSYQVNDETIAELFAGPGTFHYFGADEAAHMRDVRVVLLAFLVLSGVAATFVAWRIARHGGDPGTWRQIARGGGALAIAVAVTGIFAAVAFGVAFEWFHRLLFPGGNWAFPADSLLIRLYPYEFWQLSAAAFAALTILAGAIVWALARARSRRGLQSRVASASE